MLGEEGFDVLGSFFGEETVEAAVGGDFVQNFERGGRAIGGGFGVGSVIDVFVEEVVGC